VIVGMVPHIAMADLSTKLPMEIIFSIFVQMIVLEIDILLPTNIIIEMAQHRHLPLVMDHPMNEQHDLYQ
jgi:hypothetical protein